jgi:hypothetical protein
MLALLQQEVGEEAGDNQPYAMDRTDNTALLHADPRELDYLELEVRQNLIADANGQKAAALLVELMTEARRNGDRASRLKTLHMAGRTGADLARACERLQRAARSRAAAQCSLRPTRRSRCRSSPHSIT